MSNYMMYLAAAATAPVAPYVVRVRLGIQGMPVLHFLTSRETIFLSLASCILKSELEANCSYVKD
jgi:hypothetical protein